LQKSKNIAMKITNIVIFKTGKGFHDIVLTNVIAPRKVVCYYNLVNLHKRGDQKMSTVVTVLLVISCIVLIGSILLQSGKSAGLSGSIGGGAEQLFGKQKARGYEVIFDRVTKIAAITFIGCSLLLVYLQKM